MSDASHLQVIFDLDGTLIDTEPYRREALEQVLIQYGHHYDVAWHAHVMGRSQLEGSVFLIEKLGLSVDPSVFEQAYHERFEQLIVEKGIQPMPGVDRVIRDWHAQGVQLYIGSGAHVASIRKALETCGWVDLFQGIVAGDPPMPAKPDPAIFKAAHALGGMRDRVIVIEDAPSGIESAHLAGLPSIGLVNKVFVPHLSGAEREWFGWQDASLSELLSLTSHV